MARGENPSQVERMRAQGYTEEEIEDMLKADREIDQGADLFPLDPELEKGAKKARRADRTDTPKPRERKSNEDKLTLVNAMFSAVLPLCDTYEVVNAEREKAAKHRDLIAQLEQSLAAMQKMAN